MASAEGKFAPGQIVFVPDDERVCRACRVIRCNGYPPRMAITLEPVDGSPAFEPSAEAAAGIEEADALSLAGSPDLSKLTHLSEYAILHDLRTRYERDEIYTNVGTILVSINPFKDVSGSDADVLARARAADARAWDELPPHVFVLSEHAYRDALRERRPQSILISGESGAGKTESTKLWLRHLVSRSQGAGSAAGSAASQIEASLLACNPVLESFGNAATTRNHNSSRFGKWIEVSLDASAGGSICAARLTSYLLERSRVTGHARGERSFHAFYQLLAGVAADGGLGARLRLEPRPAAYRYLRPAGADDAPALARADAERRGQCSRALASLGLGGAEEAALDAVVAAVLHVGNVGFEAASAGEHQDDGAAVSPASAADLDATAFLLGVGAESLADALTVRLVGRFPAVRVPLSLAHANAQRDALARALYAALFDDHLFAELNRQMHGLSHGGGGGGGGGGSGGGGSGGGGGGGGGSGGGSGSGSGLYVGCLDIFGFESFETNGIEQLLINYANERLHHLFNVHVFEMDLRQLTDDGIEVLDAGAHAALAYGDNAAALALLHGGPRAGVGGGGGPLAPPPAGSVLSLLSEEVTLPNGSDANYLEKLLGGVRAQPTFVAPKGGAARGEFGVRHYAGEVTYRVEGFIEKNRNAVPTELVGLLAASSVGLLARVFGELKRAADSAAAGAGGGARQRGAAGGGARRPSAAGGAGGRGALSAVFTRSLDALLERLGATSIHFVRCVKPNSALLAGSLHAPFCMAQLRYMGMLALAAVRKRGYAHRMGHAAFLERYAMVLPHDVGAALPALDPSARRGLCERALGALAPALARSGGAAAAADGMAPFAVGRSLVCMRAPLHVALEAAREGAVRTHLLERVRAEASARHPDLDALQQVVGLALEVGLEANADVQGALATLRTLRERNEVAASLAEVLERGALAHGEVPRVQELLARAERLGVDAALLGRARALVERAAQSGVAEERLRAALHSAAEPGAAPAEVAKALGALVEAASRLDVSPELVQQARRESEAAAERARVLHELGALAAASAGAPLSGAQGARLDELLQRAAALGLGRAAEVRAAEGRQARDDEHRRREAEAAAAAAAKQAAAAAAAAAGAGAAAAPTPAAPAGAAQPERPHPRLPALPPAPGAPGTPRVQVPDLFASAQPGPQLPPLCQPLAQRLAALEAEGLGVWRVVHAALLGGGSGGAQGGEWRLVRGRLFLSADQLTLRWVPAAPVEGARGKAPMALARAPSGGSGGGGGGGGGGGFLGRLLSPGGKPAAGGAAEAAAMMRAAAGLTLPVGSIESISIGPQSAETRQALSAAAAEGVPTPAMYNVLALGAAPSAHARGAHVELLADDVESALLLVCTVQELCFRFDTPVARRGRYGALHRAQQQWHSAHERLSAQQQQQQQQQQQGRPGQPQPARDSPVLPLLRPLADMLEAAAGWMDMDAVRSDELWLLVELLEVPLPPGLVWVPTPARPGASADVRAPRVGICDELTGAVLAGHPYEGFFKAKLVRLRQGHVAAHMQTDAQGLVEAALEWRGRAAREAAEGGAPPGAPPPPPHAAARPAPPGAPPPSARAHAAEPPPAVQCYQAVLGGSVDGVQLYLESGGVVDAFYREEMGWEGVGSDWAWTRPNMGTTPLNYAATMSDVIGDDVAAQITRVLLERGADPFRDDCRKEWYLPVHNAAANGARLTVEVLLGHDGALARATTGEGQSVLHTAALCERAEDGARVVELLLAHGADASFAEPFDEETPMHWFAARGREREVALLCNAGASPLAQSRAGHTPVRLSERKLDELLEGPAPAGPEAQAREARVRGYTTTIDLLRNVMAAAE